MNPTQHNLDNHAKAIHPDNNISNDPNINLTNFLNRKETQALVVHNNSQAKYGITDHEIPTHGLRCSFFGAARTVTGSLYHLEYMGGDGKVFRFIVDAGMFQVGSRANLYRVNSFLGFDPKKVDCLVLTHAHLDHCGRIPYLVKMGFRGEIYSTPATREIAEVVMSDAARMREDNGHAPDEYLDMEFFQKQQYKAKFDGNDNTHEKPQLEAIRENLDKGEGFLKLYSTADVAQTASQFKTYKYHRPFKIHEDLEVEFFDAGHILGSSYVKITNLVTKKVIVFSGDLGNIDKPIIEDPEMLEKIENLTHVFTETTYGDTIHGQKHPKEKLYEACNDTLVAGNKVFIPSFSVERAQEIIYFLYELMEEKKLPYVPVYLDSPMANAVVDIVLNHEELYDREMEEKINSNNNPFTWKNLQVLETGDDSKTLNHRQGPCIVIAGSGMMTGGRIMKHMKFNISNPKHMLVFCGYQAEGTMGRDITDGAREVEIDGIPLEVNIQQSMIREFSAHADQLTLLKWLDAMTIKTGSPRTHLFLMHGETKAVLAYEKLVNESLPNIDCVWPKFAETIDMWK